MVDLSWLQLLIVHVSVALGGATQASVGFGFGTVAAPLVALVRPEALPATFLLLAIPLTGLMALRERHSLDVPGFLRILAGRILGTAGGIALLLAVPTDSLSALFGSVVLVAVAMSAAQGRLPLRRRPRFAAGVASGVMGTATAIGGPPLALVYQDRPGPELRATLALVFFLGILFSLAGLAVAHEIHGWHVTLALQLLPALLLGQAGGTALAGVLDAGRVRPAVLIFAAVSGVAAIVKAFLG